MPIFIAILPLILGCYSTAAVSDLLRDHSPSVVTAELSRDVHKLTIETTYGRLPSDVVFSDIMPNWHLFTRQVTEHELQADQNGCERFHLAYVSPIHGSPDRSHTLGADEPQILFRGFPFARTLSQPPPAPSSPGVPERCAMTLRYAQKDPIAEPTTLVIHGSNSTTELPVPRERGFKRGSRWLRLATAPVLDASGLVVVPSEIALAVLGLHR